MSAFEPVVFKAEGTRGRPPRVDGVYLIEAGPFFKVGQTGDPKSARARLAARGIFLK